MKSKTIYDIADAAGVSAATVSRVINNKNRVSSETRNRVLSVIKELNYELPSSIASRGAKPSLVGIVTTDILSPHYAREIDRLSHFLPEIGYAPVFCSTGPSIASKLKHIEMLISLGCTIIFCVGSVFRDVFQETSALSAHTNVNYIISNCVIVADNVYSVINDEEYAIKLCIDHLMRKGHQHIAYVKDASSFSGQNKLRAFKNNLLLRDSAMLDEQLIVESPRGLDGGQQAAEMLLNTGRPFSAVIFGGDITAIGGMKYFQRKGYRIPEDIAVIGFNNSISSQCCTPTLTTTNANLTSTVEAMISTVKQLENGSTPSHLIKVTPELIVREST